MKKKFDNTNNTLGNIIKMVRKDKGISQESLGKIVGLGKSSISKIETGMTQISLEDAAILLEAMGEELKLYVAGLYPSLETRKNKSTLSPLPFAGLPKPRMFLGISPTTIYKSIKASNFWKRISNMNKPCQENRL